MSIMSVFLLYNTCLSITSKNYIQQTSKDRFQRSIKMSRRVETYFLQYFNAMSLFYLLPIDDRKEIGGKSVGCTGFAQDFQTSICISTHSICIFNSVYCTQAKDIIQDFQWPPECQTKLQSISFNPLTSYSEYPPISCLLTTFSTPIPKVSSTVKWTCGYPVLTTSLISSFCLTKAPVSRKYLFFSCRCSCDIN